MCEGLNLQIWSLYAYSKDGQSSLTRRRVFLIMSLNAIFEACYYEVLPTLGTKVQLGWVSRLLAPYLAKSPLSPMEFVRPPLLALHFPCPTCFPSPPMCFPFLFQNNKNTTCTRTTIQRNAHSGSKNQMVKLLVV